MASSTIKTSKYKGIDFTNGTILSGSDVIPSDGLIVASISYANGGFVYVKINDVHVLMFSKDANTYGTAQSFPCYKGQRIYIETNISQNNLVTFYPAY